MKSFMMPSATDAELDLLLQYYPDDYSAGCPFDTGMRNILSTPSFLSPHLSRVLNFVRPTV